MSEVKRYTIVECHNDEEFLAKMKEVKHGDYVLYSDYEKLKQQNKQMLEALIMIYKTWHEDSILISSTKPIIESVTGKKIE